jgi:hypothetical protein
MASRSVAHTLSLLNPDPLRIRAPPQPTRCELPQCITPNRSRSSPTAPTTAPRDKRSPHHSTRRRASAAPAMPADRTCAQRSTRLPHLSTTCGDRTSFRERSFRHGAGTSAAQRHSDTPTAMTPLPESERTQNCCSVRCIWSFASAGSARSAMGSSSARLRYGMNPAAAVAATRLLLLRRMQKRRQTIPRARFRPISSAPLPRSARSLSYSRRLASRDRLRQRIRPDRRLSAPARTIAFAQSRASGCRGPTSAFSSSSAPHRVIALAT